jgi:hypothetical protein
MNVYWKCGASAAAMLAAFSLPQAQAAERQEGPAPTEQHVERPATKSIQAEPNRAQEHSAPNQTHGQTTQPRSANERTAAPAHEGRAAQQPTNPPAVRRDAKGSQSDEADRNAERAAAERNQQGNAQRKAEVTSGAREPENGRPAHVGINVSAAQKTRLHDVIIHDNALHRYRRADIQFNVAVGARVPDTITFYDPTAQILAIDPDFGFYKIIVLDDEILVVDPVTREIVDVIEI